MKTVFPPKVVKPIQPIVSDTDRKYFFTTFNEQLLIQIKNAKR